MSGSPIPSGFAVVYDIADHVSHSGIDPYVAGAVRYRVLVEISANHSNAETSGSAVLLR